MGGGLKELVRLREAINCFEQVLQLQPNIAEVHYNLGLTLYEIGETAEAELRLKKAIELKPDFSAAHSTLLCVRAFSGTHERSEIFSEHVAWAKQHANHL